MGPATDQDRTSRVPLGKLLDTLGASKATHTRILKSARGHAGVYTAACLGRPLIAPVETAWTLARQMGKSAITRHIFDRAVAKVAIGLTPEFAEEFCRQVSSRIVDVPMIVEKKALPLVVIPPTKAARLATAYGASPQKAAALSWADIVFEKDGVPMTDSYKVAEIYERRHDNLLQTVDELLTHKPDFQGLSDWIVERSEARAGGGRPRRWFEMTRDGFALVSMRLKGEKATRFQIGFIHAFNAMETELHRRIEEDRIKALAEAKAALADAERGRKNAEDQRVGAQRAATAIRESMDKQVNELKALRAQA